jgi:hypothetical protein
MNDLTDIHVWRINEHEVVAAKTINEAVDWVSRVTGLPKENIIDDNYLYEFTDWDDLKLNCENGEKRTLRKVLEEEKSFPCWAFSYMT